MEEKSFETELLLNMQMIQDDLEEDFNITYAHRGQNEQKLSGAQIYYGQKALDSASVYVAPAETFDKYPIQDPEICRIAVGTIRRQEDSPYPLLEIGGSPRWQEVFNGVQAVFLRYFSFSSRLFHILNNGGGLYELCVAALDFFRNPLYIHDENFNILAMPMWVVGMTKILVDETSGNATIPLEKIQEFKVNPEYVKTLSTHGAQLWNPPYIAHRGIYVNIWTKTNQYCGRFLINELNASFKPSDFTMAEYFVGILSMAMERNLFKSPTAITFENILQRILDGENVEEHYLLERLRMVGWQREHEYVCFKTELDKGKTDIMSSQKISSTVGVVLKKSFSFPKENFVYTVCNLTLSGYNEAIYRSKMQSLCEMTEAIIGASYPFREFTHLREYYRQAEKAIEMGRKKQADSHYLPFSDYVLDYIIGHFTEEFSVTSICSQAVLLLDQIDREKNTDYIRTLQCYFRNGCQQTSTAQELYIHRSTLTYRLEKIQELTGADLEDNDTRLYLQISIRLLSNL